MTLPRRLLLGAAGAGPLLWPRAVPALAQTPSATSRTPRDIAVMGMVIDDIVSLDPAEAFEFSGTEIVANCYERLVLPSTADPTWVEGALAESWETAADGTTTFRIRPGRRFASGNPVTAEDAAFTLERAVILNKAPAFIVRQLGFDKANVAERVTAPDLATLVVRVASPGSPSFLLYCLSAAVGSIVDKRTVMARAQGDDMGNAWLKAGNSAGSGPFILRQWRASENVSLEVNPYSPEPPTLRRLLLLHRPDPSAQLLGLQRGDIDIARTLSPDQLATLGKDQAYTLQPQLKSYLNYIALNQSHPELAKQPVRQAIKWAIDYQGIAKSITPSAYDVHQAFLPRGFPGVLTDQPFRKDPGRARALLAEAGVAKGFAVTLDHASSAPFPTWPRRCRPTWPRSASASRWLPASSARSSPTPARASTRWRCCAGARTTSTRTTTPRRSASTRTTQRPTRTAPWPGAATGKTTSSRSAPRRRSTNPTSRAGSRCMRGCRAATRSAARS